MKLLRWLLVSIALLASSVSPVLAQSPASSPAASGLQPVFGIQTYPANADRYFAVTLAPGESASLVARVLTVNSMPLDLTAYVTNALSLANGGFGAGTQRDTLTAPASWIDFPTSSFHLGTSDKTDLSFTITVPADAEPGEYVAALVAQTDGPIAIPGSAALEQVIRSAIPVLVTVPGAMAAGFTADAPTVVMKEGKATLVIPIANTGNLRVRPAAALLVANPDGTSVGTLPVTMGTVFPGTDTTIEAVLPDQVPPGTYVVSGTLTDAGSKVSATIPATRVTVAAVPTPTPMPNPVTIDPASITAVGNPIQYAIVALTVNNTGANISTGRVTLIVSRDGQVADTYVLAQNQSMPYGSSTIEARYLPATGWQRGHYAFAVRIETVEADGTTRLVVDVPLTETLDVP